MNPTKPVYVYRNLRHGRKARPLYSIMQDGKVVDRRHRVLLGDVEFIVRQAGHRRTVEEGRKNVHAFAKGYIIGKKGAFGIDADTEKDLPVRLHYNPHVGPFFVTEAPIPYRVRGARAVLLNERGITAAYVEAA